MAGSAAERPGDLITSTLRLYRDVMGEEPHLVNDFAPAFEALLAGASEIVVELPWVENQRGELVTRHQIVLRALTEDNSRVVFYNPAARRDLAAGTAIGQAAEEGPPRRCESPGLESMELAVLARYFAEGKAMALIPP